MKVYFIDIDEDTEWETKWFPTRRSLFQTDLVKNTELARHSFKSTDIGEKLVTFGKQLFEENIFIENIKVEASIIENPIDIKKKLRIAFYIEKRKEDK